MTFEAPRQEMTFSCADVEDILLELKRSGDTYSVMETMNILAQRIGVARETIYNHIAYKKCQHLQALLKEVATPASIRYSFTCAEVESVLLQLQESGRAYSVSEAMEAAGEMLGVPASVLYGNIVNSTRGRCRRLRPLLRAVTTPRPGMTPRFSCEDTEKLLLQLQQSGEKYGVRQVTAWLAASLGGKVSGETVYKQIMGGRCKHLRPLLQAVAVTTYNKR